MRQWAKHNEKAMWKRIAYIQVEKQPDGRSMTMWIEYSGVDPTCLDIGSFPFFSLDPLRRCSSSCSDMDQSYLAWTLTRNLYMSLLSLSVGMVTLQTLISVGRRSSKKGFRLGWTYSCSLKSLRGLWLSIEMLKVSQGSSPKRRQVNVSIEIVLCVSDDEEARWKYRVGFILVSQGVLLWWMKMRSVLEKRRVWHKTFYYLQQTRKFLLYNFTVFGIWGRSTVKKGFFFVWRGLVFSFLTRLARNLQTLLMLTLISKILRLSHPEWQYVIHI